MFLYYYKIYNINIKTYILKTYIMSVNISLCIPTMNRYDSFLKNNLTKYLQMDLIDEIVICDENGEDVKKIQEIFKQR